MKNEDFVSRCASVGCFENSVLVEVFRFYLKTKERGKKWGDCINNLKI